MAGGTEGRGQMTEVLQTGGVVIGNLSAWEDAVPLTEIRNVKAWGKSKVDTLVLWIYRRSVSVEQ